jgi:putative DNA primase/helicase
MTPRTLHNPHAIPRDLWPYPHFVGWRYVENGGKKPEKRPINPKTLGGASSQWPNSWTGIHTAVDTYQRTPWLSGLGFMLTERDPFAMVDLDHCLLDGQLSPLASEVVRALPTYWEVSPGGDGLRGLVSCTGALPANRKTGSIEFYSAHRYCTLTGRIWGEAKPLARVSNLDAILQRWLGEKPRDPQFFCQGTRQEPPADDAELWQRIFARNRLAYQLFHGHLVGTVHSEGKDGGPDTSRAVILLLNSLAYWTEGDVGRMARMIRQAHLDQRKFDERRGSGTWLDYQIADACAYTAGRRA